MNLLLKTNANHHIGQLDRVPLSSLAQQTTGHLPGGQPGNQNQPFQPRPIINHNHNRHLHSGQPRNLLRLFSHLQ
jgi:hypothetical protein